MSEGLEPLPADPLTVAAYLAYRAGIGRSPSTLALDRKAISYHHGKLGYPSPTASEGVKATLAGLRNQAAEDGRGDPRQARALTGSALRAIERTAHRRRRGPTGRTESLGAANHRGDVDIALASVMRDALLRRGEAARLRWGEVEFWSDGSARVVIRQSKTSKASAVLYVGTRAAKALRHIRPADADPGDRVFGLRSGRSIANRIAAMARAAGLGEGLQRALAPHRHGPGPHGRGGRTARADGGRALEVGANAGVLQPRAIGRPRGRGEFLRERRGAGGRALTDL